MAVNVLWLFLTLPQVALQCVIVVFPGHTHLLVSSVYFLQRKKVVDYTLYHATQVTSQIITKMISVEITIETAAFISKSCR